MRGFQKASYNTFGSHLITMFRLTMRMSFIRDVSLQRTMGINNSILRFILANILHENLRQEMLKREFHQELLEMRRES